jgi:hypothetical protein
MMKKKNWTKKVYEHFFREWQSQNEDGQTASAMTDADSPTVPFPLILDSTEHIWIDGPYSSSTSYMFDCDHVVFIAPGIGKPSPAH